MLIVSSADLGDRYDEISEFCHKHDEPVYITKDGERDLVVISIEAYEQFEWLKSRLNL